jgi:Rab guanine nucleotide exchange factor SEC2
MAVTNGFWHSFVTVTSWTSHQPASASRASSHSRSLSNIVRSATPKLGQAPKSTSTSEIPTTAMTVDLESARPSTPLAKRVYSSQSTEDDHDMSTIPDPRMRAMSPAITDGLASPHHPDLDEEVATLSTKLINAINHQTTLDDSLSATRLELEKSYEKIRTLEARIEEQRVMLAGDVWVKRKSVEIEKTQLLTRIAEEKKAKHDVEQQKKKIEQELENLTAALFEEANKMVISAKEEARAEHEALQRKNDLLKSQLADTEFLLKSQQEQLVELKQVMEQMGSERDDQTVGTVPSSPGFSKIESKEDEEQVGAIVQASVLEPPSPSYPTSYTYLLQPVLRTDLSSFHDFRELIRTSKRLSGQRVPSGQLSLGSASAGSVAGSTTPSSASTSPASSSPQTPNTPMSSLSAGSTGSVSSLPLPALKETKFFKRVLVEDIEPTLRLDISGLSWLARRAVLSAVTDGSLVVEPVPASTSYSRFTKPEWYPCSLCGESKRSEEHLRTHRFRTSESGSAQRYPLCKYCLNRVRSTCDFLGFLRIVKDGHWRADDDDAEKAAWEESVRLREQMFWSRIGGGVVPANHHGPNSDAPSLRGVKSPRASSEEQHFEPMAEPKELHSNADEPPYEGEDQLLEDTHTGLESPEIGRDDATPKASDVAVEASAAEDVASTYTRESVYSTDSIMGKESAVRLSLTIPGNEQEKTPAEA